MAHLLKEIRKAIKPKHNLNRVFKHYPLLGIKDAISLLSVGASLAMTSPVVMGSPIAASISLVGSALGSAMITSPRIKEAYDPIDLESRENFIIPSDTPPTGDGLIIGYTKDKNVPVKIPFELLTRHLDLIGASGVGKTTLGIFMLWQQMNLGGGFIMVDAKVDVDTKDNLGYLAKTVGRERELLILNIDDPENSNTYNPLLNGDADEVATRILNLIPSTESNAGSDHYKQSANHALTAIIGGLKAARLRYHFADLVAVFQSSAAMQDLVDKVPIKSEERKNLEIFLDKYRKLERGKAVIDVTKLKTDLGGLVGRMSQFSQGKFGKIFNTYAPEIDLFDVIKNKKMLYIMLPTMGKAVAATNLAKMIISDLMSAVYKIQALPKNQRPWPPCPVFGDEFGRYAIEESAILFEQSRSAQIFMMPSFQSYGNLATVSKGFDDMVLQSSWNKALFRFGSDESAERSADIIGKIKRYQLTITDSLSESDGSQFLQFSPQSNLGDGVGEGESWREIEEHRISMDKLSSIPIGECILTIASNVYHLKIPRITTPIDQEEEGEIRKPELVFKPYRWKTSIPHGEKGLGISDNYEKYLLANSPEAKEQLARAKSKQGKPKKSA